MRFRSSHLLNLLIAFALPAALLCYTAPRQDPLTSSGRTDVLNVHLIPHTHDDVGWLKTVDQYYGGLNDSIQQVSVHSILDSVMHSLSLNPARKFIYVEMAFFTRWWKQQSTQTQEQVKNFVKNGQLQFVNGGWCMHDEASTYFQSMIDQTTEGHTFLKNTFDFAPTVQWQIDPFGHSNGHGEISYQMGLTSLFFARMDYADFNNRVANKSLETLWYPSKSFPDYNVFTQVFATFYTPPPGFGWDVYNNDDPIQDDPTLEDYNVDSRVADFISYCQQHAAWFRTNNLLVPMGSDFNYRQAEDWFRNIDKLIYYVNRATNGTINLMYSNPAIYVEMANASYSGWPQKTDDFFPYGDSAHAYWTGYFTSRPALKRYERYAMGFLQACKQIESTTTTYGPSITLRQTHAVLQHHDGVSGTSKQHVAYDYAKQVAKGLDQCSAMMGQQLAASAQLSSSLGVCHFLNDSVCEFTAGNRQDKVNLVIYNSLAVSRDEVIRIPVTSPNGAIVSSQNGVVTSQVMKNTDATIALGHLEGTAATTGDYSLIFEAHLPPLGFVVYSLNFAGLSTYPYVEKKEEKKINKDRTVHHHHVHQKQTELESQDDISIENSNIKLSFDSATGQLKSFLYKSSGLLVPITQGFYQYFSSDGDNVSDQRSGAYLFRPNQYSADPLVTVSTNILDSVEKGVFVQEVRQKFSNSVTQVVRIFGNESFAEFEWTVGPVDTSDGWGKEIISRFTTPLVSNATWYTDSNGREMQQRKRNYRATYDLQVTEPVSQNYYPVNNAIYLDDGNARLTVLTDRSQGGSSLVDGTLELMVHRRTVDDDYRGVGEPISEPGIDGRGLIVRGRHWVILADVASSPQLHKRLAQRLAYDPVLFFSSTNQKAEEKRIVDNVKPMVNMEVDFPTNIHLLTKQFFNDNKTYLIRVNHLYEAGEDQTFSRPTNCYLSTIFPQQTIAEVVELSLSANNVVTGRNTPTAANNWMVTLVPMEIRTFQVKLN